MGMATTNTTENTMKLSDTQIELMRVMAAIEVAGAESIEKHNARMMADPDKGAGYCITHESSVALRTGVRCDGTWAGNGAFWNNIGKTIRGLSVRTFECLSRHGLIDHTAKWWENRCDEGVWHLTDAGRQALAAVEG